MTALTADDMQTWHIDNRDGNPPQSVRAAYPAGDDSLPGWITLKDHRHKIVAMVRESAGLIIQRCPNDPDTVTGLMTRLIGDVRATGCLPRHLEGSDDGEAARNEVALRTQLLKALMRDRIDGGGTHDFYAYLRDDVSGSQDGEILSVDYEDDDRFGPRLHLMLTGHAAPVPVFAATQ